MDKEIEKFNTAVLHMLIVQQAQLHALRDFAISYISSTSGLNEKEKNNFREKYEKKVQEGIKNAKAQLQAHYLTDFDVNKLLKGLFSN